MLQLTACSSLIVVLLLSSTAALSSENRYRVKTQPAPLAVLAGSLREADAAQRWELADTLLAEMLDSYRAELDLAAADRATTAARRAKLRRWQSATVALMDELAAARLRLSEGVDPVLHVDAQQQVFVFLERQAIAFSTPRPGDEVVVAQRIIDRYCLFNDCQVLQPTPADSMPPTPATGAWLLRKQRPPSYEIEGLLSCEFTDLTRREVKAAACIALADEAVQLLVTMRQVQAQGHRIDWQTVRIGTPTGTPEDTLLLNADGAYIEQQMPRLAAIGRQQPQSFAHWLQHQAAGGADMLTVEGADTLLTLPAAPH